MADDAYAELKEYFRHFDPRHTREQEIFEKLGYIDIQFLAPRIKADVLWSMSLMDTICPPSTQFAAYNKITVDKSIDIYPDFGHESLPEYNDRTFEVLTGAMRSTDMTNQTESTVYGSPIQFDENRIGAAAVYCSDGRFGEHFDDFLHNALNLPRYDRLALPGGAECLAGHFLAFKDEEALLDQLLLIRVHGIERLVLVAHQDCAFYTAAAPCVAGLKWKRNSAKTWRRPFGESDPPPGLDRDRFFARNTWRYDLFRVEG